MPSSPSITCEDASGTHVRCLPRFHRRRGSAQRLVHHYILIATVIMYCVSSTHLVLSFRVFSNSFLNGNEWDPSKPGTDALCITKMYMPAINVRPPLAFAPFDRSCSCFLSLSPFDLLFGVELTQIPDFLAWRPIATCHLTYVLIRSLCSRI